MKFAVSNICSAFDLSTIGSKVTDPDKFARLLTLALESYDPSQDRVPGQHFVTLGKAALDTVSAGVGRKAGHGPEDFVLRTHRGHVGHYLKRAFAAPVEGVAVVVNTLAAYAADPEVDAAEVASFPEGTTHVIVAVLAFAGPKSPLPPGRFVSNLAGGNNEALTYSGDDIRSMAKDIMAYWNEWTQVAD